jgi:hypothetical protein
MSRLVFIISADASGLGNFMGPDGGNSTEGGGCSGVGHGDVNYEVTSNVQRQTHEQACP